MKRHPRLPLPDSVEVGARLLRLCGCGKKLGQYVVTRVGAGRKEAWAMRVRFAIPVSESPDESPHLLRFRDFVGVGEHFDVIRPAQPSASRDAPKEPNAE